MITIPIGTSLEFFKVSNKANLLSCALTVFESRYFIISYDITIKTLVKSYQQNPYLLIHFSDPMDKMHIHKPWDLNI